MPVSHTIIFPPVYSTPICMLMMPCYSPGHSHHSYCVRFTFDAVKEGEYDEGVQTVIHELSHFKHIGDTDDEVNGRTYYGPEG